MKKNLVFFMIIIFLFVSCVSTEKLQVIHVEPSSELYHGDINIPVINGQDELNILVSKKVGEWFKKIKKEIIDWQNTNMEGEPMFAFYSDWKKTLDSKSTVSFLLSAYSFTGGANGQDMLYSFNWDKEEKKIISLDQILKEIVNPATLSTLSQVCENQLKMILEVQEDDSLEEMIQEGTKPIKSNFQVFTLSKEGVTFYFNKYQVGPGSLGIQTVFIPYIKK